MSTDRIATVLITGGTGSFGKTMLRDLLNRDIEEVRILSRDEEKQDALRNDLRDDRMRCYIGDIRDLGAVERAMRGVDAVFHAAALKQVPSCEFFPHEAVLTNIVGSQNVIRSAISAGVKTVVCLSTDKAVFPVNAMGMTKALMEKTAQAAARELGPDADTIVSSVRYGNVMYSRGSAIPLFVRQIRAGNPITVTEPTMTRFLMPLRDSVALVHHAFDNANQGDLFIKKAPAATIENLVTALRELFGAPDHPVEVIGWRHAEKLFETLASAQELANSQDMGAYYRIMLDMRDLNYKPYFSEGAFETSHTDDYHSHNTERLDVPGIKALLRTLPEIQAELAKAMDKPMRIVVTGVAGLIGWHAHARLHAANCAARFRGDPEPFDIAALDHAGFDDDAALARAVAGAQAVLHFAGVNRAPDAVVEAANPAIAARLVAACAAAGTRPHFVYANSTHAVQDTPYGRSKRRAADALAAATDRFTDLVLPHIFGEGARPDYNNVTATLIARTLSGDIPDINPDGKVSLLHAGVAAQLAIDAVLGASTGQITPQGRTMTVPSLFATLQQFHDGYSRNIFPDLSEPFARDLFNCYRAATYPGGWPRPLPLNTDARGTLFEAVKGGGGGQTFLSTTKPGVTRGDHFHLAKVERFLVVQGEAVIRIRKVLSDTVWDYRVSGTVPAPVDMPVLHTHSIENVGTTDLLTLFWTHDLFDPANPDTYADKVLT